MEKRFLSNLSPDSGPSNSMSNELQQNPSCERVSFYVSDNKVKQAYNHLREVKKSNLLKSAIIELMNIQLPQSPLDKQRQDLIAIIQEVDERSNNKIDRQIIEKVKKILCDIDWLGDFGDYPSLTQLAQELAPFSYKETEKRKHRFFSDRRMDGYRAFFDISNRKMLFRPIASDQHTYYSVPLFLAKDDGSVELRTSNNVNCRSDYAFLYCPSDQSLTLYNTHAWTQLARFENVCDLELLSRPTSDLSPEETNILAIDEVLRQLNGGTPMDNQVFNQAVHAAKRIINLFHDLLDQKLYDALKNINKLMICKRDIFLIRESKISLEVIEQSIKDVYTSWPLVSSSDQSISAIYDLICQKFNKNWLSG